MGRHSRPVGHSAWSPVPARPSWPLMVRGAAHRVCPDRVARHAWPSEKTGSLPVFKRVAR